MIDSEVNVADVAMTVDETRVPLKSEAVDAVTVNESLCGTVVSAHSMVALETPTIVKSGEPGSGAPAPFVNVEPSTVKSGTPFQFREPASKK